MHRYFYLGIIFLAATMAGCNQGENEKGKQDSITISNTGNTSVKVFSYNDDVPVMGERIKGSTKVYDKINGKAIFTLNDSTLVTATGAEKGWQNIGITTEGALKDFDKDTVKAGTKIMIKGKAVGEILCDLYAPKSSDEKQSWAILTGFVQQDNIYAYSVIENALTDFIYTLKNRNINSFRPFIRRFNMEEYDVLNPYLLYIFSENWIEDPSPLPRIVLVFRAKELMAVVHSRKLQLPNTTAGTLERGFHVSYYNNTAQTERNAFRNRFNEFILSID